MNLLNHWITVSYPFYPWLGEKAKPPVGNGLLPSEQGSVNAIVKSTSINYLTSRLCAVL